jgi:hypothetical protein
MLFKPEYRAALSHKLSASNTVATMLIKHNASVGAAREQILRDELAMRTPEPYRVSSGLISQFEPKECTSKQLDVLVYNAGVSQPLYGTPPNIVIPRKAAA